MTRITKRTKEDALRRFDEAAQQYAFRGTYSGSDRYAEVVEQYYQALGELRTMLGIRG